MKRDSPVIDVDLLQWSRRCERRNSELDEMKKRYGHLLQWSRRCERRNSNIPIFDDGTSGLASMEPPL